MGRPGGESFRDLCRLGHPAFPGSRHPATDWQPIHARFRHRLHAGDGPHVAPWVDEWVLIDRWQLRPIMIATDLLRASAFFYLAASYGSYGVGTVFVVAFLVGSFTTFFDGALFALIPSLVPRRRLADANSFVAAARRAQLHGGRRSPGSFPSPPADPPSVCTSTGSALP